jgi:alpha-ribazole phosphatase
MLYPQPEGLQANRTRLYLVRHGELVTSPEWRYVGHADVELSAAGIGAVQRLGMRLLQEQIHLIVASDLKRAVHSAEIISEIIRVQPVRRQPEFREINLGHWEGLTMQEIVAQYPDEFARRTADVAGFRVQGGESFLDVRDRAIPMINTILNENRGKNILLVAHGGANRVILCHALGLELGNLVRLEQTYACLNMIDYFDDGTVVRLVNEVASAG